MNKKLKIAFVYPKRFSFYPPDYLERGLGGTESTLVLLVEALARRGHDIEVYNSCFKEGVYNNVVWKNLWKIDEKKYFDVTISLRLLETFRDYKFNSPIRALWIQDETLVGAQKFDEEGLINMWISVSKTQKASVGLREKIKPENWFETNNAFDEIMYSEENVSLKKNKNQIIYCSAPDRGLKLLLKLWPQIKERVPDARLVVTGSYALWGVSDEENERIFEDIYSNIKRLRDVSILKRVSKSQLAKLQTESEVMLYPTDFNEMFCISVLECMACGTPVITSYKGALIERINDGNDGFLIKEKYGSLEYEKEFLDKTFSFLEDKTLKENFSENAKNKARKMSFDKLAQDWEAELVKRLK